MEKLISIIKNGKFTGTQYTKGQFDKLVDDFHKGQEESWVLNERFNVEMQEPTDEDFDFQERDYGSPTQEQLDEVVAREAKSIGEVYTLSGIDYKVPFTEAMALCLLQVKAGFEMGLTETVITMKEYDLKMPITATEFVAFSEWFAEKRNQFFTGDN